MITRIGINMLQDINWVIVIIVAALMWIVGAIVTRLKFQPLVVYYSGIIVGVAAIYINTLF